jgi:hypothetical protein
MALDRYDIQVGKHRTTVQLTEKDAKKRGLTNADKTAVRAAKARDAAAKVETEAAAKAEAEKSAGAKQGRQPANKAGAAGATK